MNFLLTPIALKESTVGKRLNEVPDILLVSGLCIKNTEMQNMTMQFDLRNRNLLEFLTCVW